MFAHMACTYLCNDKNKVTLNNIISNLPAMYEACTD